VALMTASIWFLDGPSGAMTCTRARRRARSSSVDHWGAMVGENEGVLFGFGGCGRGGRCLGVFLDFYVVGVCLSAADANVMCVDGLL
jgi:hypothetical protein